MEKFNPADPKYKKVKDLPEEEQRRYQDLPQKKGGGFVRESAINYKENAEELAEIPNEKRSLGDKILGRNKTTGMDVMHEFAHSYNDMPKHQPTPEFIPSENPPHNHERKIEGGNPETPPPAREEEIILKAEKFRALKISDPEAFASARADLEALLSGKDPNGIYVSLYLGWRPKDIIHLLEQMDAP